MDQLRAGVEAQRLGELVDLVAVEVPGAGVFAGVEVAGQRADFLADDFPSYLYGRYGL